jgi:hypothetical protein
MLFFCPLFHQNVSTLIGGGCAQGEFGTFECYFEPLIPCPKITEQLRASESFPSANKKGPRGEDCLVPDSHGKVRTPSPASTPNDGRNG